jgi:hypothetical protein
MSACLPISIEKQWRTRFAPVGGYSLAAIDEALEQALTARTDREQRWQLNQLRGLLLTLPTNGLSLEDSLRQLIRLLRTPMVDR